jgi:tRNA (cmo5U34)-methyltransferase
MNDTATWSEADSAIYSDLAAIAVPRRDEQIATLLMLAPFAADAEFAVLELGCGEGRLGAALLAAFPQARYRGLDGSESMRAQSRARLARFAGRATVAAFDLADPAWLPAPGTVDLVVSSPCVHHLDGSGKRRLFNDISARLDGRGALLLADLVAPARPEAQRLYAAEWDHVTTTQAQTRPGGDALNRRFVAEGWNYYRRPDPVDQPSRLFDQLLWLREAGFAAVDCFWLDAGHAIYGGYGSAAALPPVPPDDAAPPTNAPSALRGARFSMTAARVSMAG